MSTRIFWLQDTGNAVAFGRLLEWRTNLLNNALFQSMANGSLVSTMHASGITSMDTICDNTSRTKTGGPTVCGPKSTSLPSAIIFGEWHPRSRYYTGRLCTTSFRWGTGVYTSLWFRRSHLVAVPVVSPQRKLLTNFFDAVITQHMAKEYKSFVPS